MVLAGSMTGCVYGHSPHLPSGSYKGSQTGKEARTLGAPVSYTSTDVLFPFLCSKGLSTGHSLLHSTEAGYTLYNRPMLHTHTQRSVPPSRRCVRCWISLSKAVIRRLVTAEERLCSGTDQSHPYCWTD